MTSDGSSASGAAPAAEPSLQGRSVKGTAVTMVFQGCKMLVQIGSVVALARLVSPHEFGIYAMALPIYVFSLLFQDSGTTQAIIQRELTKVDLNNIFWFNLAVCGTIVLLLALAAPFIALFYNTPVVAQLVWGFCGVTMLNCLSAQPLALLTRRLHFGFLAAIDLASYVLGAAASLAIALIHPGYWALFAMPLVTALTNVVGAWVKAAWSPGLPTRDPKFLNLARFGSGVFAFNLLNYFTRNADLVLLGRYASAAALGAYDRANRLILFPIQQINIPLGRIFLPVLSRLADKPQEYRSFYLTGVAAILFATQPGMVWLICDGREIIPTLLGAEWRGAADIFVWIGAAALWQPLTYTAGWVFVSQGRTGAFWRWGLFNAIVSIGGFAAAVPWGATGFAVVYAIRENVIRLPVLIWLMGRRGPVTILDFLKGFAPYPVGCAAAAGVILVRRGLMESSLTAIGADLVLAYLAYGGAILLFPDGRKFWASALNAGRGLVRKSIKA